ncbi:unnamed protein product [Euphydryas editha]|uniref:Uncharacterized protein n=1 Tax=Euphydryas editha TaxID=104508 RepID=A0AAU9UW89_EUPED|nr:unnamed protein product [Euphydryas editha]
MVLLSPSVAEFEYLGHIVNERLVDDGDIERERRALSVRGNMLAPRFAHCNEEVKLTLFRAYCQTFYTCSMLTEYTQHSAGLQNSSCGRLLR